MLYQKSEVWMLYQNFTVARSKGCLSGSRIILRYTSRPKEFIDLIYVNLHVGQRNCTKQTLLGFSEKQKQKQNKTKLCFVTICLNNKTTILLNFADYSLILVNWACGLIS